MQPSSTELILIRVTGEDRPGLTSSVTEILAKYASHAAYNIFGKR